MIDNANNDINPGKQITILKFMQVSQCETYEQAKFFVSMHEYNLKDAIAAYMMSKGQSGYGTNSTNSGNISDNRSRHSVQQKQMSSIHEQFSLSPVQALILQKRLRSGSFSTYTTQNINPLMNSRQIHQNKNICSKLFASCKNSFKCIDRIKKQFKRKINSMKKDSNRIFYFQQLYKNQLQQAGFELQNGLIQGFQLSHVEQNQKLKMLQKQQVKPIFALICPNRKSPLIQNFLKNHQLMTFIRQHFEPLFITLSELKELNLQRKHAIRSIKKCPTVLTYMKNFYDLQDVLTSFQGEDIKNIGIQNLKSGLQNVQGLIKKWNYMLNLQKQLRESSVTSLNQVINQDFQQNSYDNDHDHYTTNSDNITPPTYNSQHQQTKRSLIHQQTKIYQQLVNQQVKRKKSLQIQKQKVQQMKQLRQIRRLSIPQQPSLDLLQKSIEFKFRCPLNGEYISRRFLKDEKVDILYQFVDTFQQIQFQSQPYRQFDLFTSFPPSSLFEKKQFLLQKVFDQQKENILIRQV